jgi:two-component system, sensor histidine kinase
MLTADQKLAPGALAEVAHELRAPLGGIEAMAQLLLETELSPDQRRMVAGLQSAAAHLRAVASDVIDQARGRPAAHPGDVAQRFSLRVLVDGVSAAADARARVKGLTFGVAMDEAAATDLHGDPRSIRQMLENLLDNAFKVTTAGGVALSIRQVDSRGSFVGMMFEVRDTGPGVSAEDRDKLFKSFGRIDNGVAGSGLGLSLVARMARAMGGDAGCRSDDGEGACFWFTLRLKMAEQADRTASNPVAEPLADDAPVLVIDDNQANRVIMSAILEHFGHRVIDAQSGEEALDVLGREPVKAVMLDQTLPGISGLDLLRRLRAMQGALSRLPVIPVTGHVAPEDKAAFAAAGANGFVEKPVNARAVRDALEAALSGVRAERTAA